MKRSLAIFMIMILLLPLLPTSGRTSIQFSDVSMNHWAYSAIEWAFDEGLISGYGDGSFKPDRPVTEAEFVTMVSRFSCFPNLAVPSKPGQHYATETYRIFEMNYMPLNGYYRDDIRDRSITRGQVARVIAAFHGLDLSLSHAVQYMYVNDLSTGLTGKRDYADFGVNLSMTRAEAAAFFQRLSEKSSCEFIGLYQLPKGLDDWQVPLPPDFLGKVGVEFPKPPVNEDEDEPETRVANIEIEKEELIANGEDSTFITIELNECDGDRIPYDESIEFRVTSEEGAYIDTDLVDDYDRDDVFGATFSIADRKRTVDSDGPEVTVKITAPKSSRRETDTITFEPTDRTSGLSCYRRNPVSVELEYIPQAELRLEIEDSVSNVIPADGNTRRTIKATIVERGGKVITKYDGRVRFRSEKGAELSRREVNFSKGVARVTVESLESTESIVDTITAEIVETDRRYRSEVRSIVDKTHRLEVVYEPLLRVDPNCWREPPEIAFIIDSSGSMKSNDREFLRVVKTDELIRTLDAPSNITTRFNSKGYFLDKGDRYDVLPIYQVDASGGTNIARGMDVAFGRFTGDRRKVAVLLTDGKSSEREILSRIEEAKRERIQIFTIGLGSGVNESLLEKIAFETGGRYYHVSKNIHIGSAYQSILNDISCGVPGGGCSYAETFTTPTIETKGNDLYMNTYIDNACGEVAEVIVRFYSTEGSIDYQLIPRGQDYYALKRKTDEIHNFNLLDEGEFIALDNYGNIIASQIVEID